MPLARPPSGVPDSARSVALPYLPVAPLLPVPESFEVSIDLSEFDRRVGLLRDRAGLLADRLRAAANSLRGEVFAASLELESPLRSYASAHNDLLSRLGTGAGEPRTFADLEACRRPLARMVEACEILGAVESLQAVGLETAPGLADTDTIRSRVAGVRAQLAGPDADELAKRIVERRHPINDLWTLALAAEPLDDVRWDSLAQSVERFFGRAVAIAAIRGKLRRVDREPAEIHPLSV